MKNIVIVDDQTLFLESMRELFNQSKEYVCVGIAHGEDELFPILNQYHVDVILLDVEISGEYGKDGREIAEILKKSGEYKDIKILSMSVNTQSAIIRDLLQRIGVDGYLVKTNSGKEDIFKAIETILSGSIYTSPSLINKTKRILKIETLTIREQEILKLIVKGKTNAEIAGELFVAIKTVDNHRQNIYRKMNCKNLAELAEQYYRYSFLQDFEYELPNYKKGI